MRVTVQTEGTHDEYDNVRRLVWESANYLELHMEDNSLTLVPHSVVDGIVVING